MASDAVPGTVPAGLVHGSQAPKTTIVKTVNGPTAPLNGEGARAPAVTSAEPQKVAAPASAKSPIQTAAATDKVVKVDKVNVPALVNQLNGRLNESGRADQFRVDPASHGEVIQEINPASGEVIGQFSASEFPELARSLGVSGVGGFVDSHA